MDAWKKQLKQLKEIQNKLNKFVERFENDELIIIDGTYQEEIEVGSQEEMHTNSIYMNIDYLEKEPKEKENLENKYFTHYRRQSRRSR